MKFFIWIILTIGISSPFAVRILRSYVKIENLEMEKRTKELEISGIEEEIAEQEYKINNINDEFHKETLAREKLRMALPGEVIYREYGTNSEE